MTDAIDEDTVDFKPNYDSREFEPVVLPAAFPNLLVNGACGIAVGMATNLAPHNLVEVVQALRHLISHPKADARRPDAVHPRPGPADRRQDRRPRRHPRGLRDRPRLVPDAGHVPGSRASPRGARASSSPSCPTASAPSGSSSGSRRWCRPRSCRASPTSRTSPTATKGLQLVIEVKNGFHPEAHPRPALPADADGGLVRHQRRRPRRRAAAHAGSQADAARSTSTTASTSYAGAASSAARKAQDRLHLVEGLLIAILDIDEVIQLIRSSDNAEQAKRPADRRLRPLRDPGRPTSSTCRCAG